MLHTCGPALSKVLAVSRGKKQARFTYMYNVLNPLVCLTSKKASIYKFVPGRFSLPLWSLRGCRDNDRGGVRRPPRISTQSSHWRGHSSFSSSRLGDTSRGDVTDGLPHHSEATAQASGSRGRFGLVGCFLKGWNQLGGTAVPFIFKNAPQVKKKCQVFTNTTVTTRKLMR